MFTNNDVVELKMKSVQEKFSYYYYNLTPRRGYMCMYVCVCKKFKKKSVNFNRGSQSMFNVH